MPPLTTIAEIRSPGAEPSSPASDLPSVVFNVAAIVGRLQYSGRNLGPGGGCLITCTAQLVLCDRAARARRPHPSWAAGLSRAAGRAGGPVPGRRRHRDGDAAPERGPRPAARPAVRRAQPAGRQHQPGHAAGGAFQARRIHAADHQLRARRQSLALPQARVRAADRPRADHPGRQFADRAHSAGVVAGELAARIHRLSAGAAGRAQLRLLRRRLEPASRRRPVPGHDRRQDGARAL